jgi:hypothetical protein
MYQEEEENQYVLRASDPNRFGQQIGQGLICVEEQDTANEDEQDEQSFQAKS